MSSSAPGEDPQAVLQLARQLASDGKYQEALVNQIWFHDHALEHKRSLYGVRLSYALFEWVALGQKYSPALTALLEIRDKKHDRLLNGETVRHLFHDVESINSALGDHNATVALFRKLEAAQPEFATSIYDIADEALIAGGEFALARKYLGDPAKSFERVKLGYEAGLNYAETSRSAETARKAHEEIFSEDVVRIITVLDKTGDRRAAQEIRAKALAVLESPAIKMALPETPKKSGD